jgi:putative hydrolase of the HAD superfamily
VSGPTAARAAIFDYGGVVRREDPFEFDAFARGHGLAPGVLWAAFHDIPEYAPSRTGRLGDAHYRAGVARALARHLGTEGAQRLLGEWDRAQRGEPHVEPEMATLLGRLRGRVRLGLLSNAGAGAARRLAEVGVAALFDDVVCSGDVGLAKPDPAIYRLAASRLGVEPSEAVFVDDMERNVAGAAAAGMRAHLHHRSRMEELLGFLRAAGLPA